MPIGISILSSSAGKNRHIVSSGSSHAMGPVSEYDGQVTWESDFDIWRSITTRNFLDFE